jgi:hypothetical protein
MSRLPSLPPTVPRSDRAPPHARRRRCWAVPLRALSAALSAALIAVLRATLIATLGVALGAAWATPVPPPLVVEVERDGDRFSVFARAELAADARTAWDTLTDYERLPQFVPGIRRTRVLARTGRAALDPPVTVEYLGSFRLLFLSLPIALWLDVQHVPFTDVIAQSSARAVGGAAPTLSAFRGRYALAVVGAGTAGNAASLGTTRVRLQYEAQFTLAEPLPPVIGALFGTAAVRHAVREQFAAMVAEIERRARQRPSIEAGKG